MRGWTNEVAPIQRPGVRPRRLRVPRGQRSGLGLVPGDTYGCVRMGRFSVAQIEYGSTSLARPTPPVSSGMIADVHSSDDIVSARRRPRRPAPGAPRVRRGFNNDIRNIDLGTRDGSPFSGPWTRNIITLWQFLVILSGVLATTYPSSNGNHDRGGFVRSTVPILIHYHSLILRCWL